MHGYYLHYHNIEDPSVDLTGIDLKVRDQIKAINASGAKCDFIFCEQPESLMDMVRSCLPGFSDGISWPDPVSVADADFIYIRRPRFASHELISFLSSVKSLNSDIKIIYEVPTYPYDAEMENPKMSFALAKDRKYRDSLKRYVDGIVDLSGTDEIFGIKTVQMINGIDLDRVKVKAPSLESDAAINIMCAAFYTPTHGMDRFIEGMAAYRDSAGSKKLILHLAGGGAELPRIKKMVQSYHLEDDVVFYGPLNSSSLDSLYDKCTLALGVLGLFRIGAETTSALKTREYLAKGIPFVYAGEVDVFEKNPTSLCLKIPNDASPVDMEDVVAFHDDLYSRLSQQEVVNSIRKYADENVGMRVAMSDVVRYINDEL